MEFTAKHAGLYFLLLITHICQFLFTLLFHFNELLKSSFLIFFLYYFPVDLSWGVLYGFFINFLLNEEKSFFLILNQSPLVGHSFCSL